MLKCENSFFHNETHYWAVLAGQRNAKENYSCLPPLLSLSENIVILLAFRNKKALKNGLTELPFGEYMSI